MLLLAYLDTAYVQLLHQPLVAAVVGLGLVMGEVSDSLYFVGAVWLCVSPYNLNEVRFKRRVPFHQ